MLGLGVAYALWEEGLVDQLLFNASYFTGEAGLSTTVLPLVGIDLWLTLLVVAMHAVWSTFVPIVLVETIFSGRGGGVARQCRPEHCDAGVPRGLGVPRLFRLQREGIPRAVATAAGDARNHRAATSRRCAFRVRRCPYCLPAPRSPWIVGVVTFVFSSLYMTTADLTGPARLASSLVLAVLVLLLLAGWSRDQGWKQAHSLAAVTGALATYAWLGLVMEPEGGPRSAIDLVGSFAFIAVAAWLVWLARRNLKKANRRPVQTAAGQ